jgi:hypothetical protein
MMDITNLETLVIPFCVTLFFFYIEALIHYNMGRYNEIKCDLPPTTENRDMIIIIAIFSLLSTITTYYLEIYFSKTHFGEIL